MIYTYIFTSLDVLSMFAKSPKQTKLCLTKHLYVNEHVKCTNVIIYLHIQ